MTPPGPHPMSAAVASLAERRALNKALDALDALSEAWAKEVNLTALCASLEKAADVPAAIRAMVVQAWVEGAYAGRTSHATPPATIPVEALEGLVEKWLTYVRAPGHSSELGCTQNGARLCADELTQLIKERSNG